MHAHQNPATNSVVREKVISLINHSHQVMQSNPVEALGHLIQGISIYLIYPFELNPKDAKNFRELQDQLIVLLCTGHLQQLGEPFYQEFELLVKAPISPPDGLSEQHKLLLKNITPEMLTEIIAVWNTAGIRLVNLQQYDYALKYLKFGYRVLKDLIPDYSNNFHFVQITRSYALTLYQLVPITADIKKKIQMQILISHLYRAIPSIFYSPDDIVLSTNTNTYLALTFLTEAQQQGVVNADLSYEHWGKAVFYLGQNKWRQLSVQLQICNLIKTYADSRVHFVKYDLKVQLYTTLLNEYRKIPVVEAKHILPVMVNTQRDLIKIQLEAGKIFLAEKDKYHKQKALEAFSSVRQICDQIMHPYKNPSDHHNYFIASQNYVIAVLERAQLTSDPYNTSNISNVSHAIHINTTTNKSWGSTEQEMDYYNHQRKYAAILFNYAQQLFLRSNTSTAIITFMQACVDAIAAIPAMILSQQDYDHGKAYKAKLEYFQNFLKNILPEPQQQRQHQSPEFKLFSPAPSPEPKASKQTSSHAMVDEKSPDHFTVEFAQMRI